MTQSVSKYVYDISLWKNFKSWENINKLLTWWGLEGHFDFLLHGLPISFNILFRCVIYFFPQPGPQISLTSSKVMLSVPSGEGALPLLLDCRPFSHLRARLLEPPGDKNMPGRRQPVATPQPVAPAVPGEACVFAGMNESHKQQLVGPYLRAVCLCPC